MHARVNRGRTRANKGFGVRSPGEWQHYDCCQHCHVSLSVYAGDAHTMLLPPLSCARGNAPSAPTSLFSPASSYLLVLPDKQHQGQFQSLFFPVSSALVSSSLAVLLEVKTICSSAVLSLHLSQSGFLATSEQLSTRF